MRNKPEEIGWRLIDYYRINYSAPKRRIPTLHMLPLVSLVRRKRNKGRNSARNARIKEMVRLRRLRSPPTMPEIHFKSKFLILI